MLNEEIVTVSFNGVPFTRFERVQVTAAINEAARTFHVETTEYVGEWNCPPGTPAEIRANGDLLVAGYVNAYGASGDYRSHRIQVQGRGKGQDVIDSSAEHETGHFEDHTVETIGKKLDKYDVGITADVALEKIPYAQLKPGETVFRMLERYARPEGVTMMGMPDGSIRLTNAQAARAHYGILMEGWTIKSFQVDLNDGSRHSKYIVHGQSRRGTGAANLRIKQQARDSGVKRHRAKIIASETDTDPGRAKRRAHHEKERAAGKAVAAAIQTQGFRDLRGELFAPNRLIYVHAPVLMHLVRTMLIERVQFSQDKSGSLTQLTLVDPRAYKGQSGAAGGGGVPPEVAAELDDGSKETHPAWTDGYED